MFPLIGSNTGVWGDAKLIGTDWNVALAVLEEREADAEVTLDPEDVLVVVEVEHEVWGWAMTDVIVSVEVEIAVVVRVTVFAESNPDTTRRVDEIRIAATIMAAARNVPPLPALKKSFVGGSPEFQ